METDKSEMATQIMLGASDGSSRFALTGASRSASSPVWAPDGKSLYFHSKERIFQIAIDGGEADVVVEWKGQLGNFLPSPDGKSIAFLAAEERADDAKSKKEKRDWTVVDADPQNHGLWIVPVDGDGPRKHKKLVGADRHITEFSWSPDSRHIAYGHTTRPEADYWPKSDLSEVEVATGTAKPLAATNAAERDPHYSPDGRFIAFLRSTDPPRWASEDRIALLTRASGEIRNLAPTFDSEPNIAGWAGNRVLFREAKRTRAGVYAMPLDGPPSTVYEPAVGTVSPAAATNAKATHVGFARQSPTDPPEAYVLAMGSREPVRVSAANVDLPKHPLGETKVISWRAKDGLAIEGVLTLPVVYEKGKKVPLLLNIHGGPAGLFGETFIGSSGAYPIAALAAKGYAILRPNPRGSGGYGKDFRFANMKDWGGGDYQDLMAGVDKVVADGIADPGHLGVMGWSYGGYMTSWIVTQTKRFKAAAVGAGVTDLWSFVGTADIPSFLPDYFGGDPYDPKTLETYRQHSAMFHVQGVTTPTLVLHGQNDLRVPITQGDEFYRALKRQGVTTKMVSYPRTPHGPREPKFILDVMNRHIDWMDRYVR